MIGLINPYLWSATLVAIGTIELPYFEERVQASHQIDIGDDEATVQAILGAPCQRWDARGALPSLLFGYRPRRWSYGTAIDLRQVILPNLPFPNPLPFKFRFIDADETDLVIYWTSDGVVESVIRP